MDWQNRIQPELEVGLFYSNSKKSGWRKQMQMPVDGIWSRNRGKWILAILRFFVGDSARKYGGSNNKSVHLLGVE
jgi:hypothetical protein